MKLFNYKVFVGHGLVSVICAVFLVLFTDGQEQVIPAFVFMVFLLHIFFFNFLMRDSSHWSVSIRVFVEDLLPYFLTTMGLFLLIDHQYAFAKIMWATALSGSFVYLQRGLLRLGFVVFNAYLSRILIGLITFAFIAGLFVLPSLLDFASKYAEGFFAKDFNDSLILLSLELNPVVMISNIFGIDPFHAGQLYGVMEPSFIVPKLDGSKAFKCYLFFSIICWSLFFYLKYEPKSKVPVLENI